MTLQNKNVVITGKLRKMDRTKAFHLIVCEGGIPKNNMNNSIDILIIADEKQNGNTNKIKKANDHLIKISENDFYDLIGA